MPSHKNTKVIMYHLVPQNLKMSKGKTASQVSHGAIGLYRKVIKKKNTEKMLLDWEEYEKTIVLKIKNKTEINRLISKIKDNKNIHYDTIEDAGKTEIVAGSTTVLTLLGYENHLKQYVGQYKTM